VSRLTKEGSCHTTANQNASVQGARQSSSHVRSSSRIFPLLSIKDYIYFIQKTISLDFAKIIYTTEASHTEMVQLCLTFAVFHRRRLPTRQCQMWQVPAAGPYSCCIPPPPAYCVLNVLTTTSLLSRYHEARLCFLPIKTPSPARHHQNPWLIQKGSPRVTGSHHTPEDRVQGPPENQRQRFVIST